MYIMLLNGKRRVGPLLQATVLSVCTAVFAIFLCGCGAPQASDVLLDYNRRVRNALELDAPSPHQHALPTYPRRRDVRLELGDLRIGLMDLVSLERCGLEELIAERNSGLGKVMPPSQQLLYEHRLLGLARDCMDTLRANPQRDPELLEKLQEVVAVKEDDLPRTYWNATFASPEMAEHLSLAVSPLPLEAAVDVQPQLEALYYLRDLRAGLGNSATELVSQELEGHYAQLSNGRYGGQLLQSMDALRYHLQDVANVLSERQDQRPLCPQGRPTPRAEVLQNIFQKFYSGQVQPYMARVHREGRAWIDVMDALAAQQEAMPKVFVPYREAALSAQNPAAPWPQLVAAIDRHTRAWQAVFDSCGMQPLSAAGERR